MDFGWDKGAEHYMALYHKALGGQGTDKGNAASAGRGNVSSHVRLRAARGDGKAGVPRAVRDGPRMMLEDRQRAFQASRRREKERKQVYYMSMEFLVGTSACAITSSIWGSIARRTRSCTELGFSLPRALRDGAGRGARKRRSGAACLVLHGRGDRTCAIR